MDEKTIQRIKKLQALAERGGAVAAGRHCRAAGTVSEPPV